MSIHIPFCWHQEPCVCLCLHKPQVFLFALDSQISNMHYLRKMSSQTVITLRLNNILFRLWVLKDCLFLCFSLQTCVVTVVTASNIRGEDVINVVTAIGHT